MNTSKLIIVEGPQGTGKTTVTDFIRYSMPYTNLYRLCGTSQSTPDGLDKSTAMYNALMSYIYELQKLDINLLFDRTFFTEEVYCRLGFKEYSFTDKYLEYAKKLNDMSYDIYYISLYLNDTSLYEKRLQRKDKGITKYAKFNVESSVKQQQAYLQLASEIEENYKNIKVYKVANDGDFEELKSKIKSILEF